MVQVTAGANFALRLNQLDLTALLDGDVVARSSTGMTIQFAGGLVDTFTGVGITYDGAGDPSGGTITGVRETLNGIATFEISGMNTPVPQFVEWVLTSDNPAAVTTILGGNDNVTGSNLDDYLHGYAGHDNLFGGAGSDTLLGGDGNDHLYGQSANGGTDGADQIYGGAGSDYLQGNAGNDTLDGGDGSDRVNGGGNDDLIFGAAGNDTINGNLGNDDIDGGAGNDSLRGGQGNDSIKGGDGDDSLSGDLGQDVLTGGAGADVFQFSGQGSTVAAPDRITDFADSSDRLSVGFTPAAVLAGTAQASLSAAATVAQQLFDGHAGNQEVAAIQVGSDTYVFYAANGGATVDSAIQLSGIATSLIGAADFI